MSWLLPLPLPLSLLFLYISWKWGRGRSQSQIMVMQTKKMFSKVKCCTSLNTVSRPSLNNWAGVSGKEIDFLLQDVGKNKKDKGTSITTVPSLYLSLTIPYRPAYFLIVHYLECVKKYNKYLSCTIYKIKYSSYSFSFSCSERKLMDS
jgi:hypothetical protein